MSGSSFVSTDSLGVAVRGHGGLGGEASHLKMFNLGPSRRLLSLPSWSCILALCPPSVLGRSQPPVQPFSVAHPCHLSGEQSPGRHVPQAQETIQQPVETGHSMWLVDVPTWWNKGHRCDFWFFSLLLHIEMPTVVDRTTKCELLHTLWPSALPKVVASGCS